MTTREIIYDYRLKIIEYKKRLKETDYKAIKFAEGEISEEEYTEIRALRRAWRAEINYIEYKISELLGNINNSN